MAKICKRCIVSGKVQGVFFRANTEKQAVNLGLTGWVRNLSDGRVEVFMCGEEKTVSKLESWLHVGPDQAVVDGVEIEVAPLESYLEFKVLR